MSIERLLAIMAKLRDPDEGCEWDLAQNFSTIAPYTIEEAYEVSDAIERGNMAELKQELGDLLLQVVFHARMAEEEGHFAFEDVARAISDDASTVVGWSSVHNNYGRDFQAFRWTEASGMQPLSTPGVESEAHDVSADGAVIVGSDKRVSEGKGKTTVLGWEAFRWTDSGDRAVGFVAEEWIGESLG